MELGRPFCYTHQMLRVVSHKSAAAARQYYSEGLRKEDYYSEGQEVAGKWFGKAAKALGVSGDVTPEAFSALLENRHPVTGERLTPRTKADRRVGYDLNFHAPKSLSLVHALTGDERIVGAFREAVAETMKELEALTTARVRKGGAQREERVTGNLVWAEFVHFTARPIAGTPDPHLHVHCFTFNATFDGAEDRWKAASFIQLKQNAPYCEAAFHSRLSAKVAELGYGVERTRNGWEVSGVSRDVIDRFSRRTDQIEKLAAKKGITDPHAKDALGAACREGKRHGVTISELRAEWEGRLSDAERMQLGSLRARESGKARGEAISARQAMDYALQKRFANGSVVEVNRVVAEALRFGVGFVTPDAAWKEFAARGMVVRKVADRQFCTTLNVLAEEVSLINFVRTGRGGYAPLGILGEGGKGNRLSSEQMAAVRHILESNDQVIAVRGGAGVGKTTLMKEAVEAIERSGTKVFAFAPSAAASRETLRESGFANAETVAHLLTNTKLQKEVRGQVLWIDEAGLLGIRDMWEILKIAGTDTRVILTGDIAQHAPVSRGDPLRLLQEYAGLKIAEVTKIRRQVVTGYKEAVAALSKGDLQTAFRRLDDLGAILEIEDDAERYRMLTEDYLECSRCGSIPLVVSPTHSESAKVTEAIRAARVAAGELKGARIFTQYHNLQWEESDRKLAENYTPGLVVQFHQNAKGIRRGEMFKVTGRDEQGGVLAATATGREVVVPLTDAARFLVYEERRIEIARGERIRITRNGETADGRRISNGNVFTVQRFNKDGDIVLTTGGVLKAEHGHLRHGYCETSHSSQSKSVRDVIVAQSADSFIASSREQFYVTVSRGRASIRIYTDDRQGLQQAVGNSSHRRSAIEFAGLTNAEVSSFMDQALNADQWRERIRSRAEEGKAVSFVENLMKQRRSAALAKPEGAGFADYLEMRKRTAGPDGKSRSKGSGGKPRTKGQSKEMRGRSFLRPTSPKIDRTALRKNAEAGKAMEGKEGRFKKALDSSVKHFKQVFGRNGTVGKKPDQKLPKNNILAAAKHGVKQRVIEPLRQAANKGKIKQMNKAPKPPAPTPRRTK